MTGIIRISAVLFVLALTACADRDEVAQSAVSEGAAVPVPAPARESGRAQRAAADAAYSVAPAPPVAAKVAGNHATQFGTTQFGGQTGPYNTPGNSNNIVRTGSANIKVDSLEVAIAAIRNIATQTGANVTNTSISAGTSNIRNATIELRVPAQRFDAAVDALGAIGTVQSVDVHAIDVGEEFVDLEARLANSRRLEARLVQLLETRTGRLEDVLNVERELARVREEIERVEGRLRYLREHVALSTLVVSMHEPAPLTGAPGSNVLLDALRAAWRNLVGVVAFAIAALGFVLPIGGLVWLVWQLRRRRGWFGAVARAG